MVARPRLNLPRIGTGPLGAITGKPALDGPIERFTRALSIWGASVGDFLNATDDYLSFVDTTLALRNLENAARCQVSQSAVQSIASGGAGTALSFDTVDLDPLGFFDVGTPTVITPTLAGWYRVTPLVEWASDVDYTRQLVSVQKNATELTPPYRIGYGTATVTTSQAGSVPLIEMNGTTDTLRLLAFQANASAGANDTRSVFLVEYVPIV